MTNPYENIKPNVFEAMREILPNYEYLSLRNPLIPRPKIPEPFFIIDDNPDGGSVRVVPISTLSQKIIDRKINTIRDFDLNYAAVWAQPLYRGESQVYEKQIPGIERNPSNGIHLDDQKVIDNIKIIDFLKFIVTLPEIADIKYYNLAFDIEALAQHYGFRTKYLDLTTELLIAAFFATHHWNKETEEYDVREDGLGCLFRYYPALPEYGLSPVGSLAFKRPKNQYSYVYNPQDPVAVCKNLTVIFHQKKELNQRIHEFYVRNDVNNLFPEELVAFGAKEILKRKSITRVSAQEYSKNNQRDFTEIEQLIERCGYIIEDQPAYKISRQQRKRSIRNLKKDKGVKVGGRKVFYSEK